MPVDTYLWDPLDYSKIPDVEECGLCHRPMHILRVNRNVCFWVHTPEDAKQCRAPIAFKTSFTRGVREFLREKQEQMAKNIEQAKRKSKRPRHNGKKKRA